MIKLCPSPKLKLINFFMCPLLLGYFQQWKYNKEQNCLSSQNLHYSKGRDRRCSRHIWKCYGKKMKPVKPCMRRRWAWYPLQDGHRRPHWDHDLWKTGPEETEGLSHVTIWGNTISPRNNIKYKVSRVRVWLTCLRNSQTRLEQNKGGAEKWERRSKRERGLPLRGENSGFCSKWDGIPPLANIK